MKPEGNLSLKIKKKASEIGFDSCGISKAAMLEEPAMRLKKWLQKGYHANMKYMENHFEKRVDPRKLMEGAKSVISVILNYTPQVRQTAGTYLISKYAYGEDYHFVLKRKLRELLAFIREISPGAEGRYFVDSAPVMDREWAVRAGLGWIGKHSLLISKELGSFIFIGELIVNLELEYDEPIEEYCGTCTRCIDSCPTGAIVASKIVDSNKCISYHTIENREEIPEALKGKFRDYIFGCDICQDVCPWNHKKVFTKEAAFAPTDSLLSLKTGDFGTMDHQEFNALFKKSPVKRTGYQGLKKNIEFIKQ